MSAASAGAPSTALVVGASGGIGAAFVRALARDERYACVLAAARRGSVPQGPRIVPVRVDVEDEASIAALAATLADRPPLTLVLVASGVLHDARLAPEKTWASLTGESLARAFAINAIGPALLAKHLLPRLATGERSVFAALSARVGSIGDNRLGGWYAYRASKAALNMLLRTFAIELARRSRQGLCVGLHPGTVDTGLSRPFHANLAPGQLVGADEAVARLLAVLERLTPADSGGVFAWDGSRVPE